MKKTGPRESILIARASAANSGATSTSPTAAITMLTMRATVSATPWFRKPFDMIRTLGLSASIAILPVSRS